MALLITGLPTSNPYCGGHYITAFLNGTGVAWRWFRAISRVMGLIPLLGIAIPRKSILVSASRDPGSGACLILGNAGWVLVGTNLGVF